MQNTEKRLNAHQSLIDPKNGESKSNSPSPTKGEDVLKTSPQLRWVQEKEIGALPLPDVDEDSITQQAGQVHTYY